MKFENETPKDSPQNWLKFKEKGPEGKSDFLDFLTKLERKHPGIRWLSEKTKEDIVGSVFSKFFLVAKEKNETLAVLIAEINQNQKSSVYAEFMTVDPEHQGQGIGTAFLNYLKSKYQTINIYAYSLGKGLGQEDLYKFYIRNGFKRTDEESHHMIWTKDIKTGS